MSNFKEITLALSTQLGTLTGGYPIAWPNRAYKPTAGTSYLALNFLPAFTAQADLGTSGLNENLGVAQVDIWQASVAAGGDGWAAAYDKADQIAEHFKRGTKLVNGGITVTIESVEIGPQLNEDGWFQIPVSINYRAYTAN